MSQTKGQHSNHTHRQILCGEQRFDHTINLTGNVTLNLAQGAEMSVNGGIDIYSYYGVSISCGQVIANDNGIYFGNEGSIGYTSSTDFITVAELSGTVSVKEGCMFTDSENEYSGTLISGQKTALAGKTLTLKIYAVTVGDNITA